MHHGQAFQAHACGLQRGCVRQVGRRQPGDAVPRCGEPGQGRQHDLQLADAFRPAQHLDQPGRPASAGQLGVERRIAGLRRGGAGGGGSAAAPDGMPLENVC